MIEVTARLDAAAGRSSETTVALVEQTDERAALSVEHVAGGSCGTVVLVPGAGHRALDERSSEEC